MRHKILYLGFLLALGIFGCKKDDCIEETRSFDPRMIFSYPIFTKDRIITNVDVNPSNSDELLLSVSLPNCTVYRYNLKSKEILELFKTNYYQGVSWGPNNWIVFARDRCIWKMKSNKDSLVQINNSGKLGIPIWSPDGKTILCHSWSTNTKVLLDPNGNIIDTLWNSPGSVYSIFMNDELIIQGDPNRFITYNIKSKKREKSFMLPDNNTLFSSYFVIVDNIIYYCNNLGHVRFININNQDDLLLFDNCNGIKYSFQCYDKNTETIYAQKTKIVDVNEKNQPIWEVKLVRFDKFLNHEEEVVINLPQ